MLITCVPHSPVNCWSHCNSGDHNNKGFKKGWIVKNPAYSEKKSYCWIYILEMEETTV